MSADDHLTKDDRIAEDSEWLKSELKHLTRRQRVLIINEYDRQVQSYGIGIKEYQRFISLFNEELKNDRPGEGD